MFHFITACPQQGPNLMGFANGRQNENFKISLKSPNTLKNTTPPTTASSGGHGMPGGSGAGSSGNSLINAASLGLSPAVSILPNVTSTNPKTPSPSTHEVIRTRALPEKVSLLIKNLRFLFSNFQNVCMDLREKQDQIRQSRMV